MRAQNVKVTTTSGFEGIKIEEYLEPITAHVVVGMNLFKDFLAGLSDIFGGKSGTYQNTLTAINEEVINKLRKKAFSIGGNCVLSLKIDNDEISAQGKSMIMVTALGTAARANFSTKSIPIEKETKSNIISIDYFNFLKKKKQYLKACDEDSININESFWEFVKNNKFYELSDYIINKYIDLIDKQVNYGDEERLSDFKNNITDYFSIIDSGFSIDCLYKKLGEKLSSRARRRIIKIIKEIRLVDYSEVISLLKQSDFVVQKTAVEIAQLEKETYDKSDLKLIAETVKLIMSIFPERGEKTTKKKILSTKEKEIWICECKKVNDVETEYCVNCDKDIFGFDINESKPDIVTDKLLDMIEILGSFLERE